MKSGHFLPTLAAFGAALGLAAACGGEPVTPLASSAPEAAIAAEGSLQWAAAGGWRLDKERARDPFRHPVETLSFFGVKPSDTVVEIAPGGGWYTAILGPYLMKGGGQLYAANVDPEASEGARANVDKFSAAFVDHPETYGKVTLSIASRTSPGIAPDGSADVVLTFRNVHNWMAGGYADKIFADAFRALKPGGVLGVVEHRLPSARDQDVAGAKGYVLESYIQQLAQNAGFVFEEASEINANPKDTADYPLGVWMLPPNLDRPEPGTPDAASYDEAKYTAIGESDRMTLRFRKPAAAPTAPAEAPATPPPG